jgi:hypothetical protein
MHYLPRVSDTLCMSRRRTEAQPTSMSAGVECPVMHAVVMRTCLSLHRRSEVHIYVNTHKQRERERERESERETCRCTDAAQRWRHLHPTLAHLASGIMYRISTRKKNASLSLSTCCSYLSLSLFLSLSLCLALTHVFLLSEREKSGVEDPCL